MKSFFYLFAVAFALPLFMRAQLSPAAMLTGAEIHYNTAFIQVDMNQDGRMDLLVNKQGGSYPLSTSSITQLSWYRNEGNGEFSPVLIELSYAPYTALSTTDLDDDGDPDLIRIAGYQDPSYNYGTRLEWLENLNGLGTAWEQHILYEIPGADIYTATSGDLNNDGTPDFAFSRMDETTVKVFFLVAGPNGPQLENGGTIDFVTTYFEHIYILDKNGDGWNDLLVKDDGGNFYCALSQSATGSGYLPVEALLTAYCCNFTQATFSDLTADGLKDLVVRQGNLVLFFENTGGSAYAAPVELASQIPLITPGAFLVADLDGNSYPDIIQPYFSEGAPPFVFLNEGPGEGFSSLQYLPTNLSDPTALGRITAIMDVDNDDDPDYLYQMQVDSETPTFLPTHSGWLLQEGAFDEVVSGPLFQMALLNPNKPKLIDIDGDGDKDLLLTGNPSTELGIPRGEGLGVYENIGDTRFVLRSIFREVYATDVEDSDYGTMFATAEDMDGDGDLDILCGGDGKIFWVENLDGDFAFAEPEVLATQSSNHPDWFFTGMDCDQDGDTDVLATTSSGIHIYYKEDGVAAFSGPAQVSNIGNAELLEVGDINGDGDPDLAFIKRNLVFDATVYVVSNLDGQGSSWSAAQQIGVFAHNMDRIQLVNMDQDGDLDLLINGYSYGNDPSERFVWVENTSGNFSSSSTNTLISAYTLLAFAHPMALDYDGDGWMDIVMSLQLVGPQPWSLVLYTNQGNNSFDFTEPTLLLANALNMELNPLFLDDVDDNGTLDLLLTESLYGLIGQQGAPGIYWYPDFLERAFLGGQLYFDLNGNGQKEPGELGLANLPVSLSPNNINRYTNEQGNYRFDNVSTTGDYTLAYAGNGPWVVSSNPSSWEITNPVGTTEGLDLGLVPADTIYQGALEMANLNAQCNQVMLLYADLRNQGTVASDANLQIVLDPKTTFVAAEPTPVSVNGNTLTFALSDIFPTYNQLVKMRVQLPDETYADSSFSFSGTMEWLDDNGEVAGQDAGLIYMPGLNCAIDPNDKLMTPDRGSSEHYILYSDSLEYTVRFQNTGNDTASRVRIVDLLDPGLDLSTFELLSASHPYEMELDLNNRRATWLFEGINLPDSTTNFLESQGYVKYRVQVQSNWPAGTLIQNQADIFFDLNAPIHTNTVSNHLVEELPLDTCGFDLTINVEPDDPDMIYCPGDIVLFTAPFGLDSYQWYLGFSSEPVGGTAIPGATNNAIAVDVATLGFGYFYLVAEDDGCVDTSATQLIDTWNFLPPVVASTGDTEFCSGDSLPIWYPSAGAATYQWYLNGSPIPGANDSLYWVQAAGTYVLEISYQECPNFYQNSGVGPTFAELTPIPTEIIVDPGLGISGLSATTGTVVQWYLNELPIPGATQPTYVADMDGLYQVEVIDAQGCTVFSPPLQVFIESVKTVPAAVAVYLYPNPAGDRITIESPGEQLQQIRLTDITGRVLSELWLEGTSRYTLDLSALPTGTILCRITLANQAQHVERLIRME